MAEDLVQRGGRIAVVRLTSLGDVALASAVIEALSGRARTLLVTSAAYAPLFEADPRLERVVAVSNSSSARWSEVVPEPLDALLDLQGTARSARLLRGARARLRARVRKDSLGRRLAVLRVRWGWRPIPAYRRYLRALEQLTGETEDARPRLVVSESRQAEAMRLLRGPDRWVGFSPGTAWRNKQWPLERHVQAVRSLLASDAARVAVFFGPEEGALRRSFESALGADERLCIVEPGLGLLPALFERLTLLVTGDSGPLHVAEAVGTPVVALFGPTIPEFGFRPVRAESRVLQRDLWCRPCHVHGGDRCPRGHHRCLLDISVEDVLREVSHVLQSGLTTPAVR